MESLLRKYLLVVDLAVVGLCSVLMGHAVAPFFGTWVVPAAGPARPSHVSVRRAAPEGIVERNIFCSTCAPRLQVAGDSAALRRTDLPLDLVSVAHAKPAWHTSHSTAVLRDRRTKEVGAYRHGDTVMGASISAIKATRVYLVNAGRPEYVDLVDEPVAAPEPAHTDETTRGIRKTGPHSYEIERPALEAVLGNPSVIWQSARSFPEVRDGKTVGIRLATIRAGSPLSRLGLLPGDVLTAINGLELNGPEKALEVYGKLRSASHLVLALERAGQRIELSYGIR